MRQRNYFLEERPKQWLERIASVRETERCVFFHPDPLIPGNGHCQLYVFRPSVCRLFPFAAMKNEPTPWAKAQGFRPLAYLS
ncbi:MAG: YkgJ family cysteine cluster protein [Syntrophaceae bacterium]|nr:YkgJ family cysteine cluster protein [Syntrophaceae bacterium]